MTSGLGEATNVTLLEAWEWYAPSDGSHYRRLKAACSSLKHIGIDHLWLPPGCKAGHHDSNGYDTYDLYDLGEFDQKAGRRTKWGDIDDLLELVDEAQKHDLGLLWDAVLNHKAAADYVETCKAVAVDKDNRLKEVGAEVEVDVWTGYNFHGRADRYSSMKYNWRHFSGTDWEAKLHSNDHLYRFVGDSKPGWAKDVDDSLGNADYLMGNNLDYSNAEVRTDIKNWGLWIAQRLGLAGFRLDAVKHFSSSFLLEWIAHLDSTIRRQPLIMIGEYWRDDLPALTAMIEKFGGRLRLFDVTLAGNMSKLSFAKEGDMRLILNKTLTRQCPEQAVPFVLNHDTQSRYERDHEVTAIAQWFIPLAYAFILLRTGSNLPCVFYGDLYGISGAHPLPPSCSGRLPQLVLARKLLAYGPMHEYMDDRNCIGFTREGPISNSRKDGLAVIMSNAYKPSQKQMFVGRQHAGGFWTDILGNSRAQVRIDNKGCGVFICEPRSVSVWAVNSSHLRTEIDKLAFDSDIYKHTKT